MVHGVQIVANLVTRYSIVEKLYLGPDTARITTGQLSGSITRLYTAILEYLLKAKHYYDRNTMQRIGQSVVQSVDSNVDTYLRKISTADQDVKDCITLVSDKRLSNQLQNTNDSLLAFLERLLSQLDGPMYRSANLVSELHNALKADQRQKLLQWLSTIPYLTHHRTMGKDFLSGSGSWLYQSPEYLEWQHDSASSILWLRGIPGSGKSKLVYSVIEKFRNESALNSAAAPIAYFYCVRNNAEPERADPEAIMRSILRQLSCSNPDLPVRQPVVRAYEEKKEEAMGEPPSLSIEERENLILTLLENDPATIIIDALDECDPLERYKLLDALRNILSKSASLVKIFVSYRDDGDIVCRLIESPNIYICASKNHGDIKRFIEFEVDKAIKGKRILRGLVPEDVRAEITQTLIRDAQGMFRWVSLQIQNLCDPQRIKHPGEVRQELK